jgi:hypothetical protein
MKTCKNKCKQHKYYEIGMKNVCLRDQAIKIMQEIEKELDNGL